MNKLELLIYNAVKKNAYTKNLIRNIYQSFFDLFPRKRDYSKNRLIVLENSFYGFHDQTPFSKDNSKLLSHRTKIPLRMPQKGDKVEVGFYYGSCYSSWKSLGESLAWNYHKGCRLQWVDENKILYNNWNGKKLVSNIISFTEKSVVTDVIDWPVDSIAKQRMIASSFSYERLEKMMPGYGYFHLEKSMDIEVNCPSSTGLYLIDLKLNKRKMLYSLEEIKKYAYKDSMDEAYHFITHSLFSPDEKYLAFLHRWYVGSNRNTRLLVLDIEKNVLYESPTSGMVSHYVWNKRNEIVAFCSIENIFCHVLFLSPQMTNYKIVGYPALNSDGHQSFITETSFVTDTYPDKMRMAKIYKVDIDRENIELICDLNSPKKFQSPDENHHWACDLHPRVSEDGKFLSFDSVHTGVRSHCIMCLN